MTRWLVAMVLMMVAGCAPAVPAECMNAGTAASGSVALDGLCTSSAQCSGTLICYIGNGNHTGMCNEICSASGACGAGHTCGGSVCKRDCSEGSGGQLCQSGTRCLIGTCYPTCDGN